MNRAAVRLIPLRDGVMEQNELSSLIDEFVIVLDPAKEGTFEGCLVHKSIVVPPYQVLDSVQLSQNSHRILWSPHREIPQEVDLIGRGEPLVPIPDQSRVHFLCGVKGPLGRPDNVRVAKVQIRRKDVKKIMMEGFLYSR